MVFPPKNDISDVALNILNKRYFRDGETTWEEVAERIVKWVCSKESKDFKEVMLEMVSNRYFLPNSPCIVNSGTKGGGLCACFVVDFEDSIEGIYKTKLEFAQIAKKGGGCGTTLSKIRPENSIVKGSVHGFAGGPVRFFDTICHDMTAMTQAGFREMAMMGTLSVYHPDILKFIKAKEQEGKMHTTNISVVVDNSFMLAVSNDGDLTTAFLYGNRIEFGPRYKARDIFNQIVDNAWENGEPGLLFYDKINDSPYKYSNQEIMATNPCGEQPLPFNGVCNLGSLDISKFLDEDNTIDLWLLEVAVRNSIRFLDNVASKSSYPTKSIKEWVKNNRPVGLGIMGLADYYLQRGVVYGSDKSLEELEFILSFMKGIAEDESIKLGEERGVPNSCSKLPTSRRNVTVLSIAPTGTISLIAGCNSGIEPFFSEVVTRTDKTGTYTLGEMGAPPESFRCAVSRDGSKEVTWEEHVKVQASAQKFVDSGVSKTINMPNYATKDDVYKAYILAWELGCKGITVYRNGSREIQVLSPIIINNNSCPVCDKDLIHESGCSKCSDDLCGYTVCTI